MGIGNTRFKGRVKIRGRPKEQARAEIMIMRQKEGYEARQRRRRFFTLLDIVAIIAFLLGIYSIYTNQYLNGLLLILIGLIIIGYFILRRSLKNRKHGNR